jgi:hypothetical protein
MKAMIYLSVLGFVAAIAVARPVSHIDDREVVKLRALADKLILTANGLSSVQDQDGLRCQQTTGNSQCVQIAIRNGKPWKNAC